MYGTQTQSQLRPLHPLQTPELLAPAGSFECAAAAFHYGADAVYLGLKRFSARAEAANFSLEELADLLGYARSLALRRKVFVTLNTVVLGAELPELLRLCVHLAELEPDAIIVQDLGLARLLRRHLPSLCLHASTQMAVHNLEGVRMLRELGFRRVNLARELTLEEIRRIAAEGGLECEVFCHGALCYSYSGLCHFSSHLCGRSGNRGRCAYPCRDRYAAAGLLPDGRAVAGLPFSMKDLSRADDLDALRAAGVAALKIEGRMKSPLYVAAVTHYYRRLLDGALRDPAERAAAEADLRTIFSRASTPLHLHVRRNPDAVDPEVTGHRGTPIGTVETAGRVAASGLRLTFTTARELERHDGLQIDLPGADRPFGFALDEWRVLRGGRPDPVRIPAGTGLELLLPREAPAIPVGAAVYCASSQRVKRSFEFPVPKPGAHRVRFPVDVTVRLTSERLELTAALLPVKLSDASATATATAAGPFTPARDAAGTATAVRTACERLGDTPFRLNGFTLDNPGALFAPASVLNQARRELMGKLEPAWNQALDARATAILLQSSALCLPPTDHRPQTTDLSSPVPTPQTTGHRPQTSPSWSLMTDRLETVAAFTAADWDACAELVVSLDSAMTFPALRDGLCELRNRLGAERLRLALPIITRGWEADELTAKIRELTGLGFHRWQAANLSAWEFLERTEDAKTQRNTLLRAFAPSVQSLAVDWTIPVFNPVAAAYLLDLGAELVTLSPEDSRENLHDLLRTAGADRLTVVVWQDTPLFISESCPAAALTRGCTGPGSAAGGACRANGTEWAASKGGRYYLCSRGCRSILVDRRPFCLAAYLPELEAAGARRFRMDFLYRPYTPDEAVTLWRQIRAGRPPAAGTHDGNYRRGFA